jgi:hypothetical protein
MLNHFLRAGTHMTLPDGMASCSGQSALNSSMDESERELTPQEADEARTERRLRREIRKLTVEPSPLDDTDTEMADTQDAAGMPPALASVPGEPSPLDDTDTEMADTQEERLHRLRRPRRRRRRTSHRMRKYRRHQETQETK